MIPQITCEPSHPPHQKTHNNITLFWGWLGENGSDLTAKCHMLKEQLSHVVKIRDSCCCIPSFHINLKHTSTNASILVSVWQTSNVEGETWHDYKHLQTIHFVSFRVVLLIFSQVFYHPQQSKCLEQDGQALEMARPSNRAVCRCVRWWHVFCQRR